MVQSVKKIFIFKSNNWRIFLVFAVYIFILKLSNAKRYKTSMKMSKPIILRSFVLYPLEQKMLFEEILQGILFFKDVINFDYQFSLTTYS